MDSTYFLRQLDIADPSKFKDKPITVIGAGGIGAATVIALAKTGFENITVYDFDTIEEHNFPNQLLPMWVGDQATMFNSMIIAGHIAGLLVAYLNGWRYPFRFYLEPEYVITPVAACAQPGTQCTQQPWLSLRRRVRPELVPRHLSTEGTQPVPSTSSCGWG